MKKVVWVGLAIIIICLILAYNIMRNGYSPDIRIGVALPLTGRAATYGERSLQGIQLASDMANKELGLNRQIRIIVEDTQSQAASAVNAFTKLIAINQVPVVVGLLTSDEALACVPLAQKYKVVLFTPGAISEQLEEAGEYVFRNRESAGLQASVLAATCVQRTGTGSIAILYANAANALSYRDAFVKACESFGANVGGTVSFNEGKTDYRSELEQVRKLKPSAVYLAGYDSELGLILKQAHEIGFETHFYASAGAVTPKLLEVAGEGAEGLIAASASFDPQSTAPHIQEFVDSYKDRFGKEPEWLAANSYDAILMLVDILGKGTFDSKNINNGLATMRDFPGVSGTTTFDETGGVKKPIQLVQVEGGKFIPLGN